MNINKLRNRAITATITVLNKAKSDPKKPIQLLHKALNAYELDATQQVRVAKYVRKVAKEQSNA